MDEELLMPIANKTTEDNKTGSWRVETPDVTDKCTGCGVCTNFCPDGCISLVASSGKFPRKAQINYDYCKGCLICMIECPVKAIVLRKKECAKK